MNIYLVTTLASVLVAWSVEAIVVGDTDWSRITWDGVVKSAMRFIDFDVSVLSEMWEPALETVLMATLATLLGLLMAIPVAWLGADNISPLGRVTYLVGRTLMTLSRSVHEVVWGLIFVAAVGLGALAGVLAMAVRSIGFISKTVAEAIGQTSRFTKIYEEYKKAPEVTRKRMYLETMERVLGGTDKIILDSSGQPGSGVVPYLPLGQIELPKSPAPSTQGPR